MIILRYKLKGQANLAEYQHRAFESASGARAIDLLQAWLDRVASRLRGEPEIYRCKRVYPLRVVTRTVQQVERYEVRDDFDAWGD